MNVTSVCKASLIAWTSLTFVTLLIVGDAVSVSGLEVRLNDQSPSYSNALSTVKEASRPSAGALAIAVLNSSLSCQSNRLIFKVNSASSGITSFVNTEITEP